MLQHSWWQRTAVFALVLLLEEWLLIEAKSVTDAAPVTVWEVEGATLRQQGAASAALTLTARSRARRSP